EHGEAHVALGRTSHLLDHCAVASIGLDPRKQRSEVHVARSASSGSRCEIRLKRFMVSATPSSTHDSTASAAYWIARSTIGFSSGRNVVSTKSIGSSHGDDRPIPILSLGIY